MSSLRLQDTALLTKQYPELTFGQVQQFIYLASRLKDNILLASSVLVLDPPDVLPPTISMFLQDSCGISTACVETCWNTLKLTIWHDANSLKDSLIHDFAAHGHALGLCEIESYMLIPFPSLSQLFASLSYLVSSSTYLYQCELFT